MKVAAVLFVALAALSASAQTTHNVLLMNGTITQVFRTSKACRGLTEVVFFGKQQPEADYAMAVAGNGHGAFEVLLFNMGDAPVNHWFGTDTKKGTERACKWLRKTK